MNCVQTLDHFHGLDGAGPTGRIPDLASAFSKLKPKGMPVFPRRGGSHALDVIASLAREATDAVDSHSSRHWKHDDREAFARLLVAASIAAAKSDQRLNEGDLRDLATAVSDEAAGESVRDLVRTEILRPMMIEHLTHRHWTRAETVEVYTASRLATDAGDELSEHYLKMLAARLGLEQAMTDQVEAAISSNR